MMRWDRLRSAVPRQEGNAIALPSPSPPARHLSTGEYCNGWSRVLKAAGATQVGTHGSRHRSATDIANPGIPVKARMALAGLTTVTMVMRYIHTEDAPVRQAAEFVAARRKTIAGTPAAQSLESAPTA